MPNDGEEDDLPGLEPDRPQPADPVETDSDASPATESWTDTELNEWFEGPFGGADALDRRFEEPLSNKPSDANRDIHDALVAYAELLYNEAMESSLFLTPGSWSDLGRETKARFRRAWESRFGTDPAMWPSVGVRLDDGPAVSPGPDDGYRASVELELTRSPFGGQVDFEEKGPTRDDARAQTAPSVPLGVIVGGIAAALGVAVVIGFLAFRDSDDTDAATDDAPPATQPEPPATIENPPTDEDEGSIGAVEEPVPVATPDVTASAFPDAWNMTATKTATIVPAPDFISATPIGAVLPWSVAVTESCSGDRCTYASTVRPPIPEVVFGEIPEAVWVVDGARWTLDASWFTVQASFDGTLCLIEDQWTYEFTVTEAELIDGRSVAIAFEGTWIQRNRLDLSSSTGDLSLCGELWELIDEWSVFGTAA